MDFGAGLPVKCTDRPRVCPDANIDCKCLKHSGLMAIKDGNNKGSAFGSLGGYNQGWPLSHAFCSLFRQDGNTADYPGGKLLGWVRCKLLELLALGRRRPPSWRIAGRRVPYRRTPCRRPAKRVAVAGAQGTGWNLAMLRHREF